MNRRIKIIGIIALLGVAVGGFALTKFLTRNVYKYKYGSFKVVEYSEPPLSSNDIE